MTTLTKLHDVIRSGIDRTIADAVQATEPNAFTQRPAFHGAKTTFRVPLPLSALAPAILAERHALQAARRLAAMAREDGATWTQIAIAAAIRDDLPARERAYEAWAWAAGDSHDHDASVSWRCGTCHQLVIDRGPYGGHPAESERGHHLECARQRAAILAYEQELDDDDD
jgi:hypothetical protein